MKITPTVAAYGLGALVSLKCGTDLMIEHMAERNGIREAIYANEEITPQIERDTNKFLKNGLSNGRYYAGMFNITLGGIFGAAGYVFARKAASDTKEKDKSSQ